MEKQIHESNPTTVSPVLSQQTAPASEHAKLADLYMPVRRYALIGILYGILGGISLNLILFGLLVIKENQILGLAILSFPIIFWIARLLSSMNKNVPTLFMLAFPILSFYIAANVFFQTVGVIFSAVVLYSMPGMTIGAIVGVMRRPKIPRAHDAPAENVLLYIAIPLIISIAVWVAYIVWGLNYLEKLMK